MKTGDVTKNFNEKLQIYLSFEELNGVFLLFYILTISNLIHAGILLLLFYKKKKKKKKEKKEKKEDISWL